MATSRFGVRRQRRLPATLCHCEQRSDAAISSSAALAGDCCGSSLLAMTVRVDCRTHNQTDSASISARGIQHCTDLLHHLAKCACPGGEMADVDDEADVHSTRARRGAATGARPAADANPQLPIGKMPGYALPWSFEKRVMCVKPGTFYLPHSRVAASVPMIARHCNQYSFNYLPDQAASYPKRAGQGGQRFPTSVGITQCCAIV
jgi:hypothetical protein